LNTIINYYWRQLKTKLQETLYFVVHAVRGLYQRVQQIDAGKSGVKPVDHGKIRTIRAGLEELHQSYESDTSAGHDVFYGGRVREIELVLDVFDRYINLKARGAKGRVDGIGEARLIAEAFLDNPKRYLCLDEHRESSLSQAA